MDVDKLSVVVAEFVMGGWNVLRLGGEVVICYRKKMYKKELEMGDGERKVDRQVMN